jgi:ATP-binding cassette subfamily F protein uup
VEFNGTVLLVSHDRAFLNEVCTSLLVFEGDGKISEYVGGYDDWQKEKTAKAATVEGALRPDRTAEKSESENKAPPAVQKKTRKLTNKERAELEALPKKIEALETEQAQLTAKLADPVFFKKAGPEVSRATARLSELEAEIAATYARWTELEQ